MKTRNVTQYLLMGGERSLNEAVNQVLNLGARKAIA
jgi:hypothetical protein